MRVALGENPRQFAGSGAEIEHSRRVSDGQEIQDGRRPARAARVVLDSRAMKAAGLLAQPTPASRKARFSFSISRAITSR
jgi:predicted NAD/FAD-binding protein